MHLPVTPGAPARRLLAEDVHRRALPRSAAAPTPQRRAPPAQPLAFDPDTGPLPGITVRIIEFWLTVTAGDGAARTPNGTGCSAR